MFSVSSYLRAPPGCTSSSYRAPVGASASQQRLEGLEPPNIRFANDQSGNPIPDRSSLPLLPSVQILFRSFCGKCLDNPEIEQKAAKIICTKEKKESFSQKIAKITKTI